MNPKQPCKIHVGGKWRGDSYISPAAASAVAAALRTTTKGLVEVLPKGELLPDDDAEKSPKPPKK